MVYDFIKIYGNLAWVFHGLDLHSDKDYYYFLQKSTERVLNNPFDLDGYPIVSDDLCQVDILYGTATIVCPTCTTRFIIRADHELALCIKCAQGIFLPVVWHEKYSEVVKVLSARPNMLNRNAYYYETVEDLLDENKEHL